MLLPIQTIQDTPPMAGIKAPNALSLLVDLGKLKEV